VALPDPGRRGERESVIPAHASGSGRAAFLREVHVIQFPASVAAGADVGDDSGVRGFIAVDAPPEIRKLLVRVQAALRRADADVRWVEEENLHLSLKFLGDVTQGQVLELQPLLRAEAALWPAMRLTYAGIGVFPSRGLPRVVWAGATGDLEQLAGLAAAVERAAERVGVPREGRPFVAHLTLGRVKSGRNARRLQAVIEEQRHLPLGTDTVRDLVLYQSTLTSGGPVYQELVRLALGG
jgi:2'-5' RNA ligase